MPLSRYSVLWTAEDVARVAQVNAARARKLLAEPGAPPPAVLRGERLVRWNALAVMAWLHQDDWRAVLAAGGPTERPAVDATAPPSSGLRWTPDGWAEGHGAAAPVPRAGRLLSQPAPRRAKTAAAPAAATEVREA